MAMLVLQWAENQQCNSLNGERAQIGISQKQQKRQTDT